MVITPHRDHHLTVWTRDLTRTAWAWSCCCGIRYRADLPDRGAARTEAHAHVRAMQRGAT